MPAYANICNQTEGKSLGRDNIQKVCRIVRLNDTQQVLALKLLVEIEMERRS